MLNKLSLFVNGKVNPIGIDCEKARLSFTYADGFDKAIFTVYDGKENLKEDKPCYCVETKETFAYFDTDGFETGKKLFFISIPKTILLAVPVRPVLLLLPTMDSGRRMWL